MNSTWFTTFCDAFERKATEAERRTFLMLHHPNIYV